MLATQRVNEVHMNSREFSPGGPNYAILCFLCAKHALLPPPPLLLCYVRAMIYGTVRDLLGIVFEESAVH